MLSPRLVISFYFGGDLPPGLFFGGPNSSLFGGHNQFLRYRDTESRYVHPRILLLEEATVKSSVIKRSVVIGGHKTTISLEEQFWSILKEIAQAQGVLWRRRLPKSTRRASTQIGRWRFACLYLDMCVTVETDR